MAQTFNPKTYNLFTDKISAQSATQRGNQTTAPSGDSFKRGMKSASFFTGLALIEEGVQGYLNYADAVQVYRNEKEFALQFDFNAQEEQNKGGQVAANTMSEINRLQASNLVAAYASGLSAHGSLENAQRVVNRRGATSLAINTTSTKIRSEALKRQGRNQRKIADYNMAWARYNKRIAPLKILGGIGTTAYGMS